MELEIVEYPDEYQDEYQNECLDEPKSTARCVPYSCNTCTNATSHVKQDSHIQMKPITNIINAAEFKNVKLKNVVQEEVIYEITEDIDEEWSCAKLLCNMNY